MARFTVTTLGCKVNQYDSSALAAQLCRHGLRPAGSEHQSDLLVVNTCCVTATAMRKSRQAIRRAIRKSPRAVVLVAGCYSDYDAGRIHGVLASLGVEPGRAYVAGHHSDLAAVVRRVAERLLTGPGAPGNRPEQADRSTSTTTYTSIKARRNVAVKHKTPGTRRLPAVVAFPGRQRAFVKVQDGCDAFCSYCIVPYTRPVIWSRPLPRVLDECRRLVANGYREIVLSGVFLGAYGRPTAVRRKWPDTPSGLPRLVERVAAIDGLWRVRLSSLAPGDLTGDLLAVCAAAPGVAPHFHLPLQSGSPDILKRMNRQYTAGEFRRTIDRLRDPGAPGLDRPAVTTDVIVGFPGETEGDFARTLELARYAGFAKIHAFPFSPIEGTAAWRRRGEMPTRDVVRSRMARLRDLEAETAMEYRRLFVGEQMEALVESGRTPAGQRRAMTDRYLTVRFRPPAGARLTGKVVKLHIDGASPAGLDGSLSGDV